MIPVRKMNRPNFYEARSLQKMNTTCYKLLRIPTQFVPIEKLNSLRMAILSFQIVTLLCQL
jgi:hypothetical protein